MTDDEILKVFGLKGVNTLDAITLVAREIGLDRLSILSDQEVVDAFNAAAEASEVDPRVQPHIKGGQMTGFIHNGICDRQERLTAKGIALLRKLGEVRRPFAGFYKDNEGGLKAQ
jgi:hypothetical protein